MLLQSESARNGNIQLQNRLETLEGNLKTQNLIFYGIWENSHKTIQGLLNKIKKIVATLFNIELEKFDVANIHRLGKKATRPVLLKLDSYLKMREIPTFELKKKLNYW